MEKSLFDKDGNPIAYISEDYHRTIFLWDGSPVAYLYEERNVYGINGRPLGWFVDDILYDNQGSRVGFTSKTCPVATGKETVKPEKKARDEIRPRWKVPPTPNLSFIISDKGLMDLLKEGQVPPLFQETPEEERDENEKTD